MGSTGRGRIGAVTRASVGLGAAVALAASFLVATPLTASATGVTYLVNGATGVDNTTACTVTPCKTLIHALTFAGDGDTINVAAGTYTGALTITKGVTINGAGQATTIIDAAETAPSASSKAAVLVDLAAADTNPVTISGVTIERGISGFGGGIEDFIGALNVTNSTITNNKAGGTGVPSPTGGAGIGDIATAPLTLTGDTISNNVATALSGGGIYLAGPATIKNTTISGNSTTGNTLGGGIVMAKLATTENVTDSVADSTINGNSAVLGGGIAAYSGTTLTLTGDGASPNTVSSNTGTDGAGLYLVGAASITNTTFSANNASFEGGGFFTNQAVAADAPSLTTNGAIFTGNKAGTAGGGGLLAAATTLNATGGSFDTNTTAVGGGLYVAAGNSATLTGTSIASNNALDGGGLVVAGGGTASLVGASVTNNVAGAGSTVNVGNGGGILDSGKLTITANTNLSGNQAIAATSAGSVATGWGGAVFEGPSAAGDAPTFTLTNSTISGGTLTSGTNAAIGGGIAVTGNVLGTVSGKTFAATPATFSGTGDTFSGNSALDAGGAYVGSTATFTGSTFSANTAAAGGGLGGALLVGKGAAADVPSATVDSSTILSNTGVDGAGVFVNSASSLTLQNGTAFNHNTASLEGGALYNAGTTTATDTTFENGTAAEFAGAIFDGSSVAADTPTFNGTNVTINANSSPFEGGNVAVAASATFTLNGGSIDGGSALAAGGILSAPGGTVTLSGADISGNTASASNGGGILNEGVMSITNSSLTGNTATPTTANPTTTGLGGAIYSGATTASVTTELTLSGDTFSGNRASAASALITFSTVASDINTTAITNSTFTGNATTPSFGTIDAFDPTSIVFSTIDNNTSATGASAGLFVEIAGSISVAGSDITNNTGGNCHGAVVDGGYNFTSAADGTCGFTGAKNDGAGNPQLGALTNNGGPTSTELPASTSPLINKIPVNTSTGINDAVRGTPIVLCATGAVDQRGSSRPAGPTCDIGSVEVGVSAPMVSGPTAATYIVGVAGTPQVFTSTGTPTAHLSESGALPSGVTFTDNGDGTATLAGTPAAGSTGTYAITVTAANGSLPNASTSFTLTVDQAAALAGPTSDTFTVNSPGSDVFVATGTPTPSVSEAGPLPSGVTFVDNGTGTGTLAGTPAAGSQGTYPLVITAHNGEGADAVINFTLTVLPPVTITTTTLPNGTVGVAYATTQLVATNGKTPYTWSLSSGALPAGLTLSSAGVISGKPTGPAATTTFVVKVTDSANPSGTATQSLSITIGKGATTLTVSPLLLNPPLFITLNTAMATLTGGAPAAGIAGQTIVFTAGSTTVCTSVTNASGLATCNFTLPSLVAAVLTFGIKASYAGSASWQPASGSASLL
ncbi:MAG TPA: putative Ig domain-containing protein [Acidimicrobiales bacterium]|nr:putative Ig domain-containing protein [Acidimicrobiales bacterium]